jgi:hypothetical protein
MPLMSPFPPTKLLPPPSYCRLRYTTPFPLPLNTAASTPPYTSSLNLATYTPTPLTSPSSNSCDRHHALKSNAPSTQGLVNFEVFDVMLHSISSPRAEGPSTPSPRCTTYPPQLHSRTRSFDVMLHSISSPRAEGPSTPSPRCTTIQPQLHVVTRSYSSDPAVTETVRRYRMCLAVTCRVPRARWRYTRSLLRGRTPLHCQVQVLP